MKRWIHASELADKVFEIKYMSKHSDIVYTTFVHAENEKYARQKVKSIAYRIISVIPREDLE